MSLSPLQLTKSHFSEISIRENPAAPEEFEGILIPGVAISVNNLALLEEKTWCLDTTFEIKQRNENDPYPILATFRVESFFFVHPTTVQQLGDDDKVAGFVVVNGASMVYSSVREIFALFASRFGFGVLPPLPTLDLRSLGNVQLKEPAGDVAT
jgi:hypothetical protein